MASLDRVSERWDESAATFETTLIPILTSVVSAHGRASAASVQRVVLGQQRRPVAGRAPEQQD